MIGKVVLFGATGYTGRLTAEALVRAGTRPLLAGRSLQRLRSLAAELGIGDPLPVAAADVDDPASLAALLETGDVLVSTVGPFLRLGETAVRAALQTEASYLDSTGEPPFIRTVFQTYGPQAAESGTGLLPAFGYDFVPGNLAGALALREAGESATRVDIGYFLTNEQGVDEPAEPDPRSQASGGTAASVAGLLFEPGFAWKAGRLAPARPAAKVRSFAVDGKQRQGVSLAGSEHLALPRVASQLQEVNVFLGWTGRYSRPVQAGALVLSGLRRAAPVAALTRSALGRFLPEAGTGPDAQVRARTGSLAIAQAYDATGGELAEVVLHGPNGYALTAELLAWGAARAAAKPLVPGAHGPVDAFGLDELAAGCASVGLHRV